MRKAEVREINGDINIHEVEEAEVRDGALLLFYHKRLAVVYAPGQWVKVINQDYKRDGPSEE